MKIVNIFFFLCITSLVMHQSYRKLYMPYKEKSSKNSKIKTAVINTRNVTKIISRYEGYVNYPYFCSGGALTIGYGYVDLNRDKFLDFLKNIGFVNSSTSIEEFGKDINNFRVKDFSKWSNMKYSFYDFDKNKFYIDFEINLDDVMKFFLKENEIDRLLFSQPFQEYISEAEFEFIEKDKLKIEDKIIIPRKFYIETININDDSLNNKYKFIKIEDLLKILNNQLNDFKIKNIDDFKSKINDIYRSEFKKWRINTYFDKNQPHYAMNYKSYFNYLFNSKMNKIDSFIDEKYLSKFKETQELEDQSLEFKELLLLDEKIAKQYVPYIEKLLKKKQLILKDYQIFALISMSYNVGFSGLSDSTLIKTLKNKDDDYLICHGFLMWTKSLGKRLTGLVKRRIFEFILFNYNQDIDFNNLNNAQILKLDLLIKSIYSNLDKIENIEYIEKYRDQLIENINDYYSKYEFYLNYNQDINIEPKEKNTKKIDEIKNILSIDDANLAKNKERVDFIKKENFLLIDDFVKEFLKANNTK